jgi:hypothetical protein
MRDFRKLRPVNRSMLLLVVASAACGGSLPSAPVKSSSPSSAHEETESPCEGQLPAALAVPAGNELEFHYHAVGVQIYACAATAAGPAWSFVAPAATLYTERGSVAGSHFAGPTWQGRDGSQVVGARVAGVTVDPSAIPWLLLRAASHSGDGSMSEVSFIQRVATSGGIAPSSGCDLSTIGAQARVAYSADYCFYEPR